MTTKTKSPGDLFGTILPSGNADEFPLIRSVLVGRGIAFEEVAMKGGGAVFQFAESEIQKLPHYAGAHFLPSHVDARGVVDGGHSVYRVDQKFLAEMKA